MGFLAQISTTRVQDGVRIVIAGQEKIGKTTLGSQAPGALLVPCEIGYGGVDVAHTPMIQTFADLNALLHEITTACRCGGFPYRSLIFDSATAIERMIHNEILAFEGQKKGMTMEAAMGGYGKAYTAANDRFGEFLQKLDQLAIYGKINIILTCHVFAAKIIDPNVGEYDSWDLLLHSPKNQKTYGKREMITQWADIVGFLYEPLYITKDANVTLGSDLKRGRVLGLSRTPSYVAGNRFGIMGEISIPKDQGWNHFAHAIYQSSSVHLYAGV